MAPRDGPDGSVDATYDRPSERSPLLPKPAAASDESVGSADTLSGATETGPTTPPPRKYNRAQVILLSCVRMIDPIAFFCIVPFVNQMIFDTGDVAEEDVGFYSGLIVRPRLPIILTRSLK
jgi:hypothetical protein